MGNFELETSRLLLRQWKQVDFPAFASLNADPEVMEHIPALLSRGESDSMAEQCFALISEKGWGFWAVELKASGEFLGFVGLNQPEDTFPFSPCIEVGWRLAKQYWGNGYATEAARCALKYAFKNLKLDEVVSFTAVANKRSRAVMERIGMVNSNQNFMHPNIAKNHPLSEHVLYKISKDMWQKST